MEALLLAKKHNLQIPDEQLNAFLEPTTETRNFILIANNLPHRLLSGLLQNLFSSTPVKTADTLLQSLASLETGSLPTVLNALCEQKHSDRVFEKIKEILLSGVENSAALLSWIAGNMDFVESANISTSVNIMNDLVSLLSAAEASGDTLKARNIVKSCFERQDWIISNFGKLPPANRLVVMSHLKHAQAWDHVERGSMLIQIVRHFPETEKALADRKTTRRKIDRFTSIRSFTQRHEQLRKIIEIEIPQNSKDIGIAISLGDLRENADYTSAKEQQTILMRRRSDLESMLAEVSRTDFSNFPAETVGPGTSVTIRRPNGKTELFHILGEWDSCLEKQIISSESPFALALTGKSAGESTEVNGESGKETCFIEKIEPLPQHILDWAKGDPTR